MSVTPFFNKSKKLIPILGVPEKRREYDNARGFNQSHTPQGFTDELNARPDYAPKSGLSDLLNQTQTPSTPTPSLTVSDVSPQQREEFQYNQAHSAKNEVAVSKIAAYKKFGLSYDINSEFEQEIENCTEYTGPFLKRIREYKGVTIERMADMTKISKTYIRNIEADNIASLPADVYTRGFCVSIC
jgi:hypothetical protein